jgi:Adenylyl/Guanylyl and SMODS C-terminal sensor domain
MKSPEISAKLRDYVASSVSPTQAERDLVSRLYAAVRECLGGKCYLVGSYARFTASRPMHDIDVLFVAGEFDANRVDPASVLSRLQQNLNSSFQNPTPYRVAISKQTHSITISFVEINRERFAIDVVPAFTSGLKNEFGDDIYWVPEILRVGRRNRNVQYQSLAKVKKREAEWWITSDPRGYISVATNINEANPDFRRATKLAKKWKHNCKSANKEFALKSFHVEQAMVETLKRDPRLSIFEILFRFFCDLPDLIVRPQIPDRADKSKFIDEYVRDLSAEQRRLILDARDFLLIQLENVSAESAISDIVRGGSYTRAAESEQFLFDERIPVLTDPDAQLRIRAYVKPKPGFRPFDLDGPGIINTDRRIEFSAEFFAPSYRADLLKWKVKNDNSSPQPRGEITDHRTRHNPELTKFKGAHFVECYAIKDGRCVARKRQNVVLKSV